MVLNSLDSSSNKVEYRNYFRHGKKLRQWTYHQRRLIAYVQLRELNENQCLHFFYCWFIIPTNHHWKHRNNRLSIGFISDVSQKTLRLGRRAGNSNPSGFVTDWEAGKRLLTYPKIITQKVRSDKVKQIFTLDLYGYRDHRFSNFWLFTIFIVFIERLAITIHQFDVLENVFIFFIW